MKTSKSIENTILKIYVKPKAKEFSVKTFEDTFAIFCRGNPLKGEVNRELVKELSKILKTNVQILSGLHSRQKLILIEGLSLDMINEKLGL